MSRVMTRRGRAVPAGAPRAPGAGTDRRPRGGVIAVTAVAVAVAAGAAAGGWAFGYGPFAHAARPASPAGAIPTSTATVTRGTITASEEDSGTLSYDGSFTVYNSLQGTVTWLPSVGAVIRRGGRLFAVDGQDAVLFTGQEPAWRAFAPGMSDGPDVRQLESNLVALGYDPDGSITIDDHYDWATRAAIQRWQAASGVPAAQQDGQIPLGQIVFLSGPLRVAALGTGAGAAAAPGTQVLTATSTRPVVDVALPASSESLVTVGQRVTVTLPDGIATAGRVLRIDQGGAGAGTGAGTGSGAGQGQGGSGSGGSGSSGAQASSTVTVVVGLIHPSLAAGLDQASVQVAIATQTATDVLTAPISALLARPGGGFAVTVVRGRTSRNVTVQTGVFDEIDGTVAISGPGITDGTTVEVPSS